MPAIQLDRLPDAALFRLVRATNGHTSLESLSAGAGPLLGIAATELCTHSQRFLELIEEPDRTRFYRELDRSASTLIPFQNVVRIRRPGGDYRWIEIRAQPMNVDSRIHWDGLLLDATDRRRSEIVLAASHRVAQLLGEFPPEDALWPTLLPALGEELLMDVAEAWRMRGSSLHRVAVWHRNEPQLHEFVTRSTDWQFHPGDGLPGRALAAGSPVWMPDLTDPSIFRRAALAQQANLNIGVGVPVVVNGECAGVVVLLARTVSPEYPVLKGFLSTLGQSLARYLQHHRAEVEVRTARDAAELANTTKDRFLATVSHELRTPLAGILHLVNAARQNPAAVTKHLRGIRSNAKSLSNIINDLLDTASLQAGKLALRPVPFALRDCLRSRILPLARKAKSQQIHFRFRVGRTVPDAIVADPDRLMQVLINLISNSIKFTPKEGEVQLQITAKYNGTQWYLNIQVRDTGIGIPAADRKRIFQPFEQVRASRGRPDGIGLGLAIAQSLVQQMGGQIRLRSRPGHGTTFRFQIPVTLAPAINNPIKTSAMSAMKILLVEDDPIIRETVQQRLQAFGHTVHTVANGDTALLSVTNEYQIILMDIHLVGRSGVETAQAIRDAGYTMPILAFTASDDNVLSQSGSVAGFSGHLPKSFTHREFRRIVQSIVVPPPQLWLDPPAQILEMMGGRHDLLKTILSAIQNGLRDSLPELQNIDKSQIPELAHRIAGQIGWISRKAKSEANRLEQHPDRDRKILTSAIESLIAEIEQFYHIPQTPSH